MKGKEVTKTKTKKLKEAGRGFKAALENILLT